MAAHQTCGAAGVAAECIGKGSQGVSGDVDMADAKSDSDTPAAPRMMGAAAQPAGTVTATPPAEQPHPAVGPTAGQERVTALEGAAEAAAAVEPAAAAAKAEPPPHAAAVAAAAVRVQQHLHLSVQRLARRLRGTWRSGL